MIALFKSAFTIDGETFPAGEHVVGRGVSEHWYFKALIADGLVTVLKEDAETEKKVAETKKPKTKA